MQPSPTADQETGSEKQLESNKDAYSRPPSATFLERIMTDALEDHEGTVSIWGRKITSLRFADDVIGLAGGEDLAKLVERLDKAFMTTPAAASKDRRVRKSQASSTWTQ